MKLTAIFKKIGQILGSTANDLEPEIKHNPVHCECNDFQGDYCCGCCEQSKKKAEFLIACGHCHAANENTRANCGVCGWVLKESGSYAFTPEKHYLRNLEKVKNQMQKTKDDRSKNSFFKI